MEDSSSEDEAYIETAPGLLPIKNDLLMNPYELGTHVAPLSGSSGSNVGSATEIMTNVMSQVNNGNNYGNSRRKWTYEMVFYDV